MLLPTTQRHPAVGQHDRRDARTANATTATTSDRRTRVHPSLPPASYPEPVAVQVDFRDQLSDLLPVVVPNLLHDLLACILFRHLPGEVADAPADLAFVLG